MIFNVIINFLATAQFEIEAVNQESVEGVKGGSLTLMWMFKYIPDGFEVLLANLHFGVTRPTSQAKICTWDATKQTPSVTTTGKDIFDNRTSVSYKSTNYSFTITNLQYKDAGPYLMEVTVGQGSIIGSQTNRSTITITKVKGECKFFISYYFLCQCLVKVQELVENYEVTTKKYIPIQYWNFSRVLMLATLL